MFCIGICDDEKYTCTYLKEIIYAFGEKRKIEVDVRVWYQEEELYSYLQQDKMLDILFLDIELISTTGIEVGQYIRGEMGNRELLIIFISSQKRYAMSLFRIQPIDFLIKPLKESKVEEVLEHCIKEYEKRNQVFDYRIKGEHYKVNYKDIRYFHSDNKMIKIVKKNEEVVFRGKLRDLVDRVPSNFILIHQSFLINMDYVTAFNYETVTIESIEGQKILGISATYRKKVREKIIRSKWEKK